MNRHRACRRWDGASAWRARLVLHRTHGFRQGKSHARGLFPCRCVPSCTWPCRPGRRPPSRGRSSTWWAGTGVAAAPCTAARCSSASWPRALRADACAPLRGAGPRVSLGRLTGVTASLCCGERPDGPVHSVWVLGRWQTWRTPRGLWLSFPPAGAPGFLEVCHQPVVLASLFLGVASPCSVLMWGFGETKMLLLSSPNPLSI